MNFKALRSRKLWVTVIGGALVTIGQEVGIPVNVTTELVALAAAYLIGQGLADLGKENSNL